MRYMTYILMLPVTCQDSASPSRGEPLPLEFFLSRSHRPSPSISEVSESSDSCLDYLSCIREKLETVGTSVLAFSRYDTSLQQQLQHEFTQSADRFRRGIQSDAVEPAKPSSVRTETANPCLSYTAESDLEHLDEEPIYFGSVLASEALSVLSASINTDRTSQSILLEDIFSMAG